MDPVHDKGVHGPGPYFDGPGPWTRSTEGVHVLYFPDDCCLGAFLAGLGFHNVFSRSAIGFHKRENVLN